MMGRAEICPMGSPTLIYLARVDVKSAGELQLSVLVKLITSGTPKNKNKWLESLKEFYTVVGIRQKWRNSLKYFEVICSTGEYYRLLWSTKK